MIQPPEQQDSLQIRHDRVTNPTASSSLIFTTALG
jgi:hypothetical protein